MLANNHQKRKRNFMFGLGATIVSVAGVGALIGLLKK